MSNPLEIIADYELLGAGIGAFVFTFLYLTFYRWRSTSSGKSLAYFVLSLDALFVLNILGRFLNGDYIARDYIRLAVYTAVLITMWRLVYTLLTANKRKVGLVSPFTVPPKDIVARPKRKWYNINMTNLLTPAVRKWIYGVAIAVVPLLVVAGFLTNDEAQLWLNIIAAALSIASSTLAAGNVEKAPDAQPQIIVVEK